MAANGPVAAFLALHLHQAHAAGLPQVHGRKEARRGCQEVWYHAHMLL